MIVIVGGGIIGISTAYRIAELQPNAEITIISKDLPESGLLNPFYTSSKAGAHFRPFPSKNEYELRDSKLTHETYKQFKKLSKLHPESSIKFMKCIDYIEYDNKLYESLSEGYTEIVEDFQIIPKYELPNNVKFGASYNSFCVNPHVYMEFMLQSLKMRQRINIIQREVYSLREVSMMYPNSTIFNCTGNGLLYDGSYDLKCYSIRGQTLLIRPPLENYELCNSRSITYQLSNGEWSFVIPRPLDGGIILGGTKNENLTNDKPIEDETKSLINNAISRFPELFNDKGELDILRINVGFRPARKTGVRIEREVINKNTTIIHVYGFGGSGIEMSWGAAVKAVELLEINNKSSKF